MSSADIFLVRWQRHTWFIAEMPGSTLDTSHLELDNTHCLYYARDMSAVPPTSGWECAGSTAGPVPALTYLAVPCPQTGAPMALSDGAGHYTSYYCDACRTQGRGVRWFNATQQTDLCFKCGYAASLK